MKKDKLKKENVFKKRALNSFAAFGITEVKIGKQILKTRKPKK